MFVTGAATILPTVLHLTTGIMKEMCSRGAAAPSLTIINTSLQCIKRVCDYDLSRNEKQCTEDDYAAKKDWSRLLQSAISSILHYAEPGTTLLKLFIKEHDLNFELILKSLIVVKVTISDISPRKQLGSKSHFQHFVLLNELRFFF